MSTEVPEFLPADLEVYVEGVEAPEGPAWGPDGALYLVSAARASVFRVGDNRRVTEVANTGGRPNGLAFSADGTLYVADAGKQAVLRLSESGTVEVFASEYESRQFGGPNDLAFLPNGELIFSDPARLPMPDPCMSPVYIAAPDGTVRVFVNALAYPNGVDLTVDGRGVLIAEMRANRLVMFGLDAQNNPTEEKLVRRFREPASPDGMALDAEGRIFQALPGIQSLAVVGPGGELAELYYSPKWRPSNVAFGGPDMRTVFVTSEDDGKVYAFRHSVAGLETTPRGQHL
jgi:sugar lactone lactonase YvrE